MKTSTLLFCLSILFLLTSCNINNTVIDQTQKETNGITKPTAKKLIHTVYFWYAEDANPKQLTEFEKELELLGTIKSIDQFYFGPPAATAERGPVDNTFDMCVNIFFDSVEAHDAYQIDPIHLAFVEKCKDLWEKVIVYDNELW